MKKLMILPLLLWMTGCVTYYYPETAVKDGAYYTHDNPAFVEESYGYDNGAYYPWGSVDSFYLGYGGFAGGYGRAGLSWGLSYGYSPWYDPYYSFNSPWYAPYYSPWYAPYYSHYYRPYYDTWWPYYEGCRRYHSCGHRNRYADGHHDRHDRNRHDRYTGADRGNGRYRGRDNNYPGDSVRPDRKARGNNSRDRAGERDAAPLRRYVSATPSGHSGNRGMVIRNRAGAKIGKSRVEPHTPKPDRLVAVKTQTASAARSDYRVRHSGGVVRYRSGAKQSRSHITPIERAPVSGHVEAVEAPGGARSSNYRSRQATGEIRYRSGAKQSRSRTTAIVSTRSYNLAPVARPVTRPAVQPSQQRRTMRTAPVRYERQPTRRTSAPAPAQRVSQQAARGQRSERNGPRRNSTHASNASGSDQKSSKRDRRR